jgi:UPF0755 protein
MKKTLALLIIIGALSVAGFLWWMNATQPVSKNDTSSKIFVVRKQESIREIANRLKKENLIRDPVAFFIVVKQLGIDQKIQAGDFRLSPSQDAYTIADNLTHGSLDIWITVKEGQRADEIAELLEREFQSFNPSWRNELNKHEGYLFPDTYLIPKDADIDLIIATMRNNFDKKYESLTPNPANKYSREDIVTIASMIEREARHDEDRPIVASVMYNRLGSGMALDIDATIQYAKGKVDGKWWRPITQAEYRSVKSPYNTYLQPGLPPGPIANPGVKALEAAMNPADTDFLFYITDKNGINRYAKTNTEHNRNIERYGL